MKNIEFDVGTSLAQASEILGPAAQRQNVGATSSLLGFFREGTVEGTFSKGALSVKLGSLFSVTAYASTKIANGQVHTFDVTLDTESLTTHPQTQAAIANLIAQFQRGEWKRYIPDSCPWVTGRSTLLDVSGRVSIGACPIDPALVISAQEWPQFATQKLRWQWIGDGRIATLEAIYAHDKPDVPTYTINLQFELQEAVKFYDAQSLREMKAEFGEAKVAAGAAKGAAEIKLLEDAALERGDSTITRP